MDRIRSRQSSRRSFETVAFRSVMTGRAEGNRRAPDGVNHSAVSSDGTLYSDVLGEPAMSANEEAARTLLSRIPALQLPSDLDLLVFFARHPRTLMASEQLARLVGYKPNEIAKSLDVLLDLGLLMRTPNRTRTARMYVFPTEGTNDGWLPAFVELASTRDGRLALRRALTQPPEGPTDGLGDAGRR